MGRRRTFKEILDDMRDVDARSSRCEATANKRLESSRQRLEVSTQAIAQSRILINVSRRRETAAGALCGWLFGPSQERKP
jgi:hypothetical protein